MVAVFSRLVAFTNRHPIIRGMISYGTIWPTSCIIQQTISGKTWENYDWMQALRFSLYGGFFTAPTLYAWIRLSTIMWPATNLRTSITKAVVEQMTYGPAALVCFFFGMSLMEGKTVNEAKVEMQTKFLPSYKVGICFWPVLQTINFCYIKEKNRVPFVSMCSLIWCCFLAYMHQLRIKNKELALGENKRLLKN
ncbi:mpv17-like protein isoform X1 [Anoplophora glabripennis]|uniref:mpv17-like protein isoform X1 n=2 Tax=Anoplophora glabripennis TaxID=217634 RepID=UPI0008747C83|nr:mpv17-like protein isoform X1 [Anoplophora glabripennis]XP_018568057.1 mpv17-like protein isoform X1 [Anoplophora glabripennis]XP_018568058.1 mpv17-like protein isoform X1 [Anoplophora glabripennis]